MTLQAFYKSDFLTIDIGYRYIKVIQIRKKKNNDITIINYGIGDTPKGCIKNGDITDKEKVILEIKRIISQKGIVGKEAKILISGTSIITRIMIIDKVPESELDKKAWDEINESLPINLEEHSVDYKVIGIVNEGGKEKLKLFVTAVAKKIINNYVEILQSLGLKPLAVDTPANSVSKFFQKEIVDPKLDIFTRKNKTLNLNSNAFAVMDLGSETTIVNVLNNKAPEFNRVLSLGSSNIDRVITENLEIDRTLTEKAEGYKRTYGIVRKQDMNNDLEWQCSEAARSVLDEIMKQTKVCLKFYKDRCAGEQISKMYLIGGGSSMKGLLDYFEDNLDVPVYNAKMLHFTGMDFARGLNLDNVNYLINAAGIAL
jgi:type IV pilus assembly protein PilM